MYSDQCIKASSKFLPPLLCSRCYKKNLRHLLFLENLWINIVDTTEIASRKLNYTTNLRRSEQGNAKLLSAEKCSLGLRDLKKLN